MTNSSAGFDQRQLRDALGTFVTGVAVVTTRAPGGTLYGVTANSFTSVSLDPPLVLWNQALSSKRYPAFRDSGHFAINILAEDQVALSNHFIKPPTDMFDGIDYSAGEGGVPVLHGAAAHLECVKIGLYPAGDHAVYIGRVERIGHSGGRPLVFSGGKYMVACEHH